jgi:2-oxoisovalerate dehydrogenase E2 component (dihydrolipoyl transacylase)
VSDFGVKLPDVGEGVAEAELVAWHVSVGDTVTPESVLAEVMTDKATVEISSPVGGVVTALHGEPGDTLAVGAAFVTVKVGDTQRDPELPRSTAGEVTEPTTTPEAPSASSPNPPPAAERREDNRERTGRAIAAPAVRARARELGVDLAAVSGTGPDGRVLHADLDRLIIRGNGHRAGDSRLGVATRTGHSDEPHVESVRGLRRRIAERVTASWTQIPHITYVEEVDVTELEVVRSELNRRHHEDGTHLTMLAFLVRAIVIATREQPRMNSHYDASAQTVSTFDAVHVGIATQTDDGLMVPVVRDAQARGLWDIADEIGRVSAAARDGTSTRHDLNGSTITITSLAALGGVATTPIINQPEVAIVGVNKMATRPVWRSDMWQPRSMVNLSSSFDHRIIDGWDAATFIQRIRTLLEMPALLFVND